jgi:hypothetical protein
MTGRPHTRKPRPLTRAVRGSRRALPRYLAIAMIMVIVKVVLIAVH